MKPSIRLSTKLTILIGYAIVVFQAVFPFALTGSFLSMFEFNLNSIIFLIYILASVSLVFIEMKIGWFMTFLYFSAQFLIGLPGVIISLFTLNNPPNEYFGSPLEVFFIYTLPPFVLYTLVWALIFRESVREEFNIGALMNREEGYEKVKKMVLLLNGINVVVLLVGAILSLSSYFLMREFVPNLILSIVVFVLLSKEMTAGYYLLIISLIVRLYVCGQIVFFPGGATLTYYFQIAQALILMAMLVLLFQKKVISVFR